MQGEVESEGERVIITRPRRQRSRLLVGVVAVAVAVACVGGAGKWLSRPGQPAEMAVQVGMLDDGTALRDGSVLHGVETGSVDIGNDSSLDSPGLIDTQSPLVVTASEYVFARMNQDRYICEEPAFTYYSVLLAQSQVLPGGFRFFLHLRIEGDKLFDIVVLHLPTWEQAITTTTTRAGQVPQIMGDYRLERMSPPVCPGNGTGNSTDLTASAVEWPDGDSVVPAEAADDRDEGRAKTRDEGTDETRSEGTWQQAAVEPDGITWPTAKASPAGLAHKRVSQPLARFTSPDLGWPQEESSAGSLAQLAQFSRPLGYRPPSAQEMLKVKEQTTTLSVSGEMPRQYNAAERFRDCKAFVVKDQKSCGIIYSYICLQIYIYLHIDVRT